MANYTCLKSSTFGGRTFLKGETVLEEYILPSRIPVLLAQKRISPVSEPSQENNAHAEIQTINTDTSLTIPITANGGVLELTMDSQNITRILSIMQLNVEEASKEIALIEDENSLILLNAVDSRKGVKAATEARAQALRADVDSDGEENVETDGKETAEPEEKEKDDA